MTYDLEYSEAAIEHIRALPADRRANIMDRLERRLRHEPTVVTRHRKPMDPDRRMFVAPWELRLGDVRVYYAVEEKLRQPRVIVIAVGIKKRDRVFIGGRVVAQ